MDYSNRNLVIKSGTARISNIDGKILTYGILAGSRCFFPSPPTSLQRHRKTTLNRTLRTTKTINMDEERVRLNRSDGLRDAHIVPRYFTGNIISKEDVRVGLGNLNGWVPIIRKLR